MTPEEIFARIRAVAGADTDDFLELVKLSGLDPSRDFRNADLTGIDLNRYRMDAFDLTDCWVSRGALPQGMAERLGAVEQAARIDAPIELRKDFAVFRDRLKDGTAGPEMIVLPAGSFLMGSPADDPEADKSEFPQHAVRVPRCAIGRFPVTFAEYDAFCAATERDKPGDQGWGRGRRPVINVSWHDAQTYAAWLTERTGQGYRLPSEAEWEYAARAGTVTRYWWGDQAAERWANYGDKIKKTTEVGVYPANPWGLYDTAGNVWEWVADGWHDGYDGAPDDSSPWTTNAGNHRVLRGGSWGDYPWGLCSAYRSLGSPGIRIYNYGFRLARTLTS